MATLKLTRKSEAEETSPRPPVRRPDPTKRIRNAANKPQAVVGPEGKPQTSAETQPPKTGGRPAAAKKPSFQSDSETRGTRSKNGGERPDAGNQRHDRDERRSSEKRPSQDERPKQPRDHRKQPDERVSRSSTPPLHSERRPKDKQSLADRDTPRRGGKLRDGFEPGEFNQDRKNNPKFSPQPVASQPDLPRLSKRMAELGLCSRREADEWIANGWVTVNGEVIDTLGTRIAPDARIEISKAAHQHQSETVTILLHKPVGYVSGQAEDGYQPAIVLINPENQWLGENGQPNPAEPAFKRGHLRGLAPAGRLDIDSTGLLVLTQDGRIARQLIGENSTIEKEYLVRVQGELSAQGLKLLNHGLSLDGVTLKPAKVSWQNEDQLRFVLREGRKRQIRRMCELVGLTVVGLKRVRIGSITLGRLPLGTWRYLRAGERF